MYVLTTVIFFAFTLSAATANVSFDTIFFFVNICNFHFQCACISVAIATVSFDTMEFGQPNKNHHFNMFELSVATATVSVDTMTFLCIIIFTTIILSAAKRICLELERFQFFI